MLAVERQIYFLVLTILLLSALAVTLPVIRDIVTEGLERHRERETGETEEDTDSGSETGVVEGPRGDESGEPVRRCTHCGTANDGEFRFCQECAEPF